MTFFDACTDLTYDYGDICDSIFEYIIITLIITFRLSKPPLHSLDLEMCFDVRFLVCAFEKKSENCFR